MRTNKPVAPMVDRPWVRYTLSKHPTAMGRLNWIWPPARMHEDTPESSWNGGSAKSLIVPTRAFLFDIQKKATILHIIALPCS
jgi:hypothetical protein